jgi:hypothetical protein
VNARVVPLIAALAVVVTMIVGAQSSTEPRASQMREHWTDPSTGLMWAGKDNGKDVSWNKATKYCRDLRLAGYSDWRLATRAELGAITTAMPMLPDQPARAKTVPLLIM